MSNKRRVEIPDLLQLVRDELNYLQGKVRTDVSRTEVRIISGILRKLLYDGLLYATWKAMRQESEPKIEFVDLQAVLRDTPREYVHYAYAGGAHLPGANHSGWVLYVFPKDVHEANGTPEGLAQEVAERLHPGVKTFRTLHEFMASHCVESGTFGVSRIELVRYVSNKLGGVHLDKGRAAWEDPLGSAYRLLDEEHIVVGKRLGAHYEIMSIAEDLCGSADLKSLVDKIDEEFPAAELDENVIRIREGRIGPYADFTQSPAK